MNVDRITAIIKLDLKLLLKLEQEQESQIEITNKQYSKIVHRLRTALAKEITDR